MFFPAGEKRFKGVYHLPQDKESCGLSLWLLVALLTKKPWSLTG